MVGRDIKYRVSLCCAQGQAETQSLLVGIHTSGAGLNQATVIRLGAGTKSTLPPATRELQSPQRCPATRSTTQSSVKEHAPQWNGERGTLTFGRNQFHSRSASLNEEDEPYCSARYHSLSDAAVAGRAECGS